MLRLLRTLARRLTQKQAPMLEIGTPAPAFEAVDQDGNTLRSTELVGKRYVLWFYPKADTPG